MAGYGMDFRGNGKKKNRDKNREMAITRRLEIKTKGANGNNSKKQDDELRKRTNRNKSVGGY